MTCFFELRFYLETIKGTQDHILLAFLLVQDFKTLILKTNLYKNPSGGSAPASLKSLLGAHPFPKDWTPPPFPKAGSAPGSRFI